MDDFNKNNENIEYENEKKVYIKPKDVATLIQASGPSEATMVNSSTIDDLSKRLNLAFASYPINPDNSPSSQVNTPEPESMMDIQNNLYNTDDEYEGESEPVEEPTDQVPSETGDKEANEGKEMDYQEMGDQEMGDQEMDKEMVDEGEEMVDEGEEMDKEMNQQQMNQQDIMSPAGDNTTNPPDNTNAPDNTNPPTTNPPNMMGGRRRTRRMVSFADMFSNNFTRRRRYRKKSRRVNRNKSRKSNRRRKTRRY